MKFPKSMHAEGWLDHMEKTAPEHMPDALSPNAVKRPVTPKVSPTLAPRIDEVHRVRVETPPSRPAQAFTAPTAAPVIAPKQPSMAPWILVGGAGAVAIAVAVMVSRNFAPSVEPVAPPPTVIGEAAKPSPEDAQIAAAPTSAGPVTPEATQTPAEPPPVVAAATPTPTPVEPPRVVAAAPAPKAEAPKLTPEPKPAPVTKTLTPQPEVLAQASPPPVTLREPVQPAAPTVTPPVTTPEQATTPTAPAVPPVAQATPQPQPQAGDPEDTGITIKVRSALASDATLAAVPIAVSTDHGVVKLEGQAPDPQARERATVVAAATQGVKAVDNRLTLPPVAMLQQLEPQQVARAPSNN